jgi:2-hydroxychromene-2-carboxylate isomerase
MNREVEFLFDYDSPFSSRQSADRGVRQTQQGGSDLRTHSARCGAPGDPQYIADDGSDEGTLHGDRVVRWAARYGLAFKPNPRGFMSNTLRLMRVAVAAQANGWFALYHRAVYRATWGEAQNLGDDTVLRKVLENVGVPASDADGRDRACGNKGPIASEHRSGALERGVFGAPTFFVGSEMFWSNDRFDFVEEALRKLV